MIQLKRIYSGYDASDGYRVLVDRLWPRGMAKVDAQIDLWFKDIAPSTELRQWYGHDPARWEDFRTRYESELDDNQPAVQKLENLEREHGTITLVYGARDERHSHALALQQYMDKR